MKKVLIISPYFPPSNTADMQRIRMSLPYFADFGWEAEVVTVDQKYSDLQKDDLLLQSIPEHIKVHTVKALSKKWTVWLGFGNLAFRSLWFYRQKVNRLLKSGKYDLIYFSTTQYAVCILGAYWKKRFGIPYIIDMQDPWYSYYYYNKPKDEQPPKFHLVYTLHKYMEAIALKKVSGLISVSAGYIDDLKSRYPEIKSIPVEVITFGAFEPDIQISKNNKSQFLDLLDENFVNIVYAGRGGVDMYKAIRPVFEALQSGLQTRPGIYSRLKLYFIGTSYAPGKQGQPTVMPLAEKYGIADNVTEITSRISYYNTLHILQQADALFIPGSDDPKYSASKIYPYLLTQKPVLAIFNADSPVLAILKEYGAPHSFSYQDIEIEDKIEAFLTSLVNGELPAPDYSTEAIKKYDGKNLTRLQCNLFNRVLDTP